MPRILPALALGAAALTAACAGPAPRAADPAFPPPAEAQIIDLATGEAIGFETLAGRLAAAPIAIIGELHDQPAHQRMQAALIAAAGVRAAAFEMIPAAVEEDLAIARTAGPMAPRIAEDAQAVADLRATRWAAWAEPVDALGPGAALGAGLERAALSTAITEGAAAAFDGDSALFGLDAPLPASMEAAMAQEQIEAHCNALPAEMAAGMVEAQRLRDAAFGAALLRAHAQAGGPAVLVTGNGHARRGRGTPRYLARAAPDLDLLVIGQVVRRGDQDWAAALAPWQAQAEGDAPVFDILVTVPASETQGVDPCGAFRERMRRAKGG